MLIANINFGNDRKPVQLFSIKNSKFDMFLQFFF